MANAWRFRDRHTALCMQCGLKTWDGMKCLNGHEDGLEQRVKLSYAEERAVEYVRRGMPEGPVDVNYWPGVTEADVALARSLWSRWREWVPLIDRQDPPAGENPLFSPRFK